MSCEIDGINISSIAERFGTPLYLYAGDSITREAQAFLCTLGDEVDVYYSIKANPAIGIIGLLRSAGISGAEIASSGELVAATAAGYQPERIIFAGPGKSDKDLARAINAGIEQINAESIHEIERIHSIAQELGVIQAVGVRVNFVDPDAGQGAIRTGGGTQKFGIDEDQVPFAISQIINHEHTRFAGIHTMLGSQVLDANLLLDSCQRSIDFAAKISTLLGITIPSINFGGGLGVPHIQDDPDFDLQQYADSLKSLLNLARTHSGLENTRFILEPGRALVSAHGIYLTSVLDIKESAGMHVAIVDGGIHHALLPITANQYQVEIVNRASDQNSAPVLLGGPLCTSADQWKPIVELADVQVGDLIAMYNSGAYGYTASMTKFLSHDTPPEVLVLDGECILLRERSKPEDVLVGQHIPSELE